MEYLNQTYEGVDSQPRPVSYINPCAVRNSCIDEENYETLTEVQTQFDNIYEQLPTAERDTLQRKPDGKDDLKVKEKENTPVIDDREIVKIKQDLRKTKVSMIILSLFVVVLLVISLIAVALAVTIPQRTSTENQLGSDGPQAVVAPGPGDSSNQGTRQMISDLTLELQKFQNTVNATVRWLISEQGDLMAQIRQNSNQLQHLTQQITDHSNATSLINQVIILQDGSREMQSKITEAEGQIDDLLLMQSNLQKNFNATRNNLTQVRYQISMVQNQLGTNQQEVRAVDDRVRAVQDQLITTTVNITSLNGQTNVISQQLSTTQTNIAAVRNQASSLQTSLNNHLSSTIDFYQNCHQDTASCSVSNSANSNRRILCDTGDLNANVTVS